MPPIPVKKTEDKTTNERLRERGFTTVPGRGSYKKIILENGKEVFHGDCFEVNEWLAKS